MPELHYAMEKMCQAIRSMSVDHEDLRKRVYNAFLNFHPVEPKKLSPDLGKQLQTIYDALTNTQSIINPDEGTVKTTLDAMTDKEVIDVASKIIDFFFEVEDAYYDLIKKSGI